MSDKYFKGGVRVVDMSGTQDRGYPGVVAGASSLMELARKVANLANGDGDAEDVEDIQASAAQCVGVAQRLLEKAKTIKPLVTER